MTHATIALKGVTWDHPRGYDPVVACTHLWREATGIDIVWDRHSLQHFESHPVQELARDHDLLIIDHPHIGEAVASACLVPFEPRDSAAVESVGPSLSSYAWQGRQWALPIDAAAQVQAWRPDLIERPASRWSDVVGLAREGRVACPLRPPHSLMMLLTLANNLGVTGDAEDGTLIDPASGALAIEMVRELVALLDPASFAMDPIAALELMASGTALACAPWIYGYASYAREGFRPGRIAFADIPVTGDRGVAGSVLGGAGIAVSAFSRHAAEAARFAAWITSGPVQARPYAAAGGQPGHDAAWRDPAVNTRVGDFYRATRATLDGAWVRPRHDGYIAFQGRAAERLNGDLRSGARAQTIVATLNALHRASQPRERQLA